MNVLHFIYSKVTLICDLLVVKILKVVLDILKPIGNVDKNYWKFQLRAQGFVKGMRIRNYRQLP